MFNTNLKEIEHIIPKLSEYGLAYLASLKEYNLLIENNFLNDNEKYQNNRYRYNKFFDLHKKYNKSFISLEIYLNMTDYNKEDEKKPRVNILWIKGAINISEDYETKYNFFMDFYKLVGKHADEYEMSTNGSFFLKFN